MTGEPDDRGETSRPAHLRLVWKNPCPPAAPRPVDLASAIERHLEGGDGMTDAEFVRVYARRAASLRPAWADAAAVI